jgi:hypothetical protein
VTFPVVAEYVRVSASRYHLICSVDIGRNPNQVSGPVLETRKECVCGAFDVEIKIGFAAAMKDAFADIPILETK